MSTPLGPRANWTAIVLWVAIILGYPVIAITTTALGVESSGAAVVFRAVLAALALQCWRTGRLPRRWPPAWAWLLFFWVAYFIRLAWDAGVAAVPDADFAILVFSLGVVLPALGLAAQGAQALPENQTAWTLAAVGSFICLLAIVLQAAGWAEDRSLVAIGGRLGFVTINPISLGNVATTTLLALVCLVRPRLQALAWAWLLAMGAVAGSCLVMSGSRGPFVALAACLTLLALRSRRWQWLLLLILFLPGLIGDDSSLAVRLGSGIEDPSSLERLASQASAADQFLSSPLWGDRYVDRILNEYPHNIFIETAMALGLVGLVSLLAALGGSLRWVWLLLASNNRLLALLFIQFFMGIQFSGALWNSQGFWAAFAVLATHATTTRKRRRAHATKEIRPKPVTDRRNAKAASDLTSGEYPAKIS